MSFRQNQSQQVCSVIWGLTDREKKALERSWAKVFAEDIFLNINEEFQRPHSDKASRPNTPVNVIVEHCSSNFRHIR